jgi:hypothetical protein
MDQRGVTDGKELSKSEHDIVSECSHCSDMAIFHQYGYTENANRYTFFHQPCIEPPCTRFEALESVLCDSCRHLRLWHRVICMESESFKPLLVFVVSEKDFASGDCPFCKMIGSSLLSMGYDPARLKAPTKLHLEVNKDPETDDITASINVVDITDNEMKFCSIGELHIVIRPGSRS